MAKFKPEEIQNAVTILSPLFNMEGGSPEVQHSLKVLQDTLAEMVEQEPEGLAASPSAIKSTDIAAEECPAPPRRPWNLTWDTCGSFFQG